MSVCRIDELPQDIHLLVKSPLGEVHEIVIDDMVVEVLRSDALEVPVDEPLQFRDVGLTDGSLGVWNGLYPICGRDTREERIGRLAGEDVLELISENSMPAANSRGAPTGAPRSASAHT